MRKNIARVLLYAACAVLVVFYILVLWWGKNPKSWNRIPNVLSDT